MTEVVAIVPAHDEEDRLRETLGGIWSQTVLPDRVVVIADNCTDRTIPLARAGGADVLETVGNRDKKAGALNWALETLALPDETYVLIVDADTVLSPEWIETALETFATKENIGAVGGVFLGDGKNGVFGSLQGLEYHRYRKELHRLHGTARVLTGTSTMMPMRVFREVRAARERGDLPGAGYYNVDAITEDFCLTIAVKRLGYRTVSPSACTVVTETMPDVPQLWKQRLRWQLGALDVLTLHGVNRVTVPYWWRQVETGLGIAANLAIMTLVAYTIASGTFMLIPFWLAIGGIFYLERIQSAVGGERKGVVIASTVLGDLVFDLFISVVYVWSLVMKVTRRERAWGTAGVDAASRSA